MGLTLFKIINSKYLYSRISWVRVFACGSNRRGVLIEVPALASLEHSIHSFGTLTFEEVGSLQSSQFSGQILNKKDPMFVGYGPDSDTVPWYGSYRRTLQRECVIGGSS